MRGEGSKRIALTVFVTMVAVLVGCGGVRVAPGFTDRGFSRVRIGMTQASVKRLLGTPLLVVRCEDRVYKVRLVCGRTVGETISYGPRGTVVHAGGYVAVRRGILPGASRSQVEGILHTSRSKHGGHRWQWKYTKTTGLSSRVRTRIVEFNDDHRVIRVVKHDAGG